MTWPKLVTSGLIAAMVLASAAAVTHVRAGQRERQAEAAYPPQGDFHLVDTTKMHVVVQGQGPDLVLIHGASGSTRDFTFSLMPELARNYRVFAVDRPGLGWSDDHADSDQLVVQARLIQQAVEMAGAQKPIVLGQSYGGSVALSWAVHFPDTLASLVTVAAPSHPWTTGLGPYYTITSHPLGQRFAIPLLTAFVPNAKVTREVDAVFAPQNAPEGYAEHFGPGMTLRREAMRANSRQRKALKAEIIEMHTLYDQISVPVEIIHGTKDTTVFADIHAKRMIDDIRDAKLTMLEGIGHMPHHVAVPDVIAAIDRAAARAGLRDPAK